jgi:hypothetical protein
MQRREFFRTLPALAGVAGLTGSTLVPLGAQVIEPESTQVAEIYELQAAFHRAKTTQDIELMLSLWDPEAALTVETVNPPATYVGLDQIRSFFLNSGSWQNQRFSLVPSFKTQIEVQGNYALLYFECHDIGDYALPTRYIANDSTLSGIIRKADRQWLFFNMTAKKSSPLSIDKYYK